MYLVADIAANIALGNTPEEAVNNYLDDWNEYDVSLLEIYQLTSLKAKAVCKVTITGSPLTTAGT